jgi:hypothetical protein
MRKREKTRSTKHEKSLKRKIGFKLPLIGVLLTLIVCLGLFIANQRHPVKTEETDRVATSSSKKKKAKKASEKKTPGPITWLAMLIPTLRERDALHLGEMVIYPMLVRF